VETLPGEPFVKLQVTVDVRDAQGANALNTCAEHLGERLAAILGVRPLMAIVTNNCTRRRASARCVLPAERVAHLCRGRYDPQECVRRIVAAGQIAQCDRDRAVTHNKGIMNGITALALATGNDTRALEAAVHAWASRDGVYRGLSTYTPTADGLEARIDLPLPLATVGGATQYHPTAAFCLKLLDSPEGPTLARIAASLGLAQNLAALCALVSTGIQQGHMRLHHKKQHHDKHT
jgi:hydroxymethylglutaryl-CoA reductase